jgi:hypothetical protein
MRAVGLLSVFALGFFATGCGSGAVRPTHAETSIVLDRSIGGVGLGDRRADVERRLGQGFVVKATDQKPPEPRLHTEEVLYKNGLEVWYVSKNATKTSLRRGRVIIVLTHSPLFRTSDGVHVGSTSPELEAVEGVHCGSTFERNCQHGGRVHNSPGTMFQLSGPRGLVVRIAIAYAD